MGGRPPGERGSSGGGEGGGGAEAELHGRISRRLQERGSGYLLALPRHAATPCRSSARSSAPRGCQSGRVRATPPPPPPLAPGTTPRPRASRPCWSAGRRSAAAARAGLESSQAAAAGRGGGCRGQAAAQPVAGAAAPSGRASRRACRGWACRGRSSAPYRRSDEAGRAALPPRSELGRGAGQSSSAEAPGVGRSPGGRDE